MLHSPAMNEIGHSGKKETRWKRLRRAVLETALGNFILCAALVTLLLAWRGEILYGLIFGAIFGSLVATVRSKEWERTVKLVFWLAFAVVIIVGGVQWLGQTWKSDQAERTADVRAVFLHPADRTTGPQVYMNDGTVWALIDIPANVRMIKGDKVRYIYESPPLQGLEYPACELKDVTTGYVADAERLSAPFKHSSCPPQ